MHAKRKNRIRLVEGRARGRKRKKGEKAIQLCALQERKLHPGGVDLTKKDLGPKRTRGGGGNPGGAAHRSNLKEKEDALEYIFWAEYTESMETSLRSQDQIGGGESS